MQGNRPEIIMPQTFAVILFLNSFKIFPTLCFYSHIILNKWSKKNIVDACYTAAFNIVLQARDSKGCIWGTDKSVFRRQRQINYTIHALICASVATASHFHHVEQTGSLFTPHPLLLHRNACYYSRIILKFLPLLLFSELFRHNYLRPTWRRTHNYDLWPQN